ncbi:MAG: hypothetical protein LBG44_10575 [Gemmatimonadota bacterium]|nr:hypothetical protein [Gemmatimonadota bacterium]
MVEVAPLHESYLFDPVDPATADEATGRTVTAAPATAAAAETSVKHGYNGNSRRFLPIHPTASSRPGGRSGTEVIQLTRPAYPSPAPEMDVYPFIRLLRSVYPQEL